MLGQKPVPTDDPAFKEAERTVADQVHRLLSVNGTKSVDQLHRELGQIMWGRAGMARNEAGLQSAISEISALREEFWRDVKVTGDGMSFNQQLEKAFRVADFMEMGELLCRDALHREESCGGHFREESQTEDGEALRDDDRFAYVAAWEWSGEHEAQKLHREELDLRVREAGTEVVQVSERMRVSVEGLAPVGADVSGAIPEYSTRHACRPTCRSSRCSTSSTSS